MQSRSKNTCLQKSKMKKQCWWTTLLLLITAKRKLISNWEITKATCAVLLLTTHVSWYLPSCRCGSIETLAPPLNPPRPPPPSYINTKKLNTILCTSHYDKKNALTILVEMHAFEVKICNFKFQLKNTMHGGFCS